jgi:hypothetical protein
MSFDRRWKPVSDWVIRLVRTTVGNYFPNCWRNGLRVWAKGNAISLKVPLIPLPDFPCDRSNSAIGPMRITGKFLMIPEKLMNRHRCEVTQPFIGRRSDWLCPDILLASDKTSRNDIGNDMRTAMESNSCSRCKRHSAILLYFSSSFALTNIHCCFSSQPFGRCKEFLQRR